MADRLNGYRILILETREEAQFSRRLSKLATKTGIEKDFIAAIGKARKFTRGAKPGRALREIGLEPQVTTEKPTSEGVAEMLSRIDLKDHRVGLQLYSDK